MHQSQVEIYLEQLREIKQRGHVFQEYSRGSSSAFYEEATVEVAALQLRKILELLAFGLVLVIGEKAVPAYANFVKYKNAKEFFIRLQRFNPDYYPQPISQVADERGDMQWNDIPSTEFLTPEDFAILFEHCDRILEPRRFGMPPMSLEHCKNANLRWFKKIVRLLNSHLVHVDGSDVALLFQMGTLSADPTCDRFQFASETGLKSASRDQSPKRGHVSLEDHLYRQIEFLRRSCELYDAGHSDEAVRLAVGIRILLHDTERSKSLLRQMGVKEKLKLASSFGFAKSLPTNFKPTSIFPLFASSSEVGPAVPFPLSVPPILLSVDEWWDEMVWLQESSLSRKDIILGTANKEGGAHVQGFAPEVIQELRRGLTKVTSVKVNGVETGTPGDYHFILIRQFAHELLKSDSLMALAR